MKHLPLADAAAGHDTAARSRPVLLSMGFRPFFLLAGLYASGSLVAWLLAWRGLWAAPSGWVPMWWHGHEMIFGFVVAAVCGFLLTAVPKWTGTPPVRGGRLALLVGLWLAGRVAMWAAGALPAGLVATLDLALLPALAWMVGAPIVRAGKWKNLGFPPLLVLLFGANLLTHLDALGVTAGMARTGLLGAIYVVVLLIAVIGGRIVPSFTANALRRDGEDATSVVPAPELGRAAVGIAALAALAHLLAAPPVLRGASALAAAAMLAARSARWGALRSARDPLVWILHVGHGWLVVGFALLGLSSFGVVFPETAALHAFGAGAMGTMVLAVMTRASLGHTGRPLQASWNVTAGYVLVVLGATVRVLAPVVATEAYRATIVASGTLWAAGYLAFVLSYAPILARPRVDGAPA